MSLYWEAELISQTVSADLRSASYSVRFYETDTETQQTVSVDRTIVVPSDEIQMPELLRDRLISEAQSVIQFRKATKYIQDHYVGAKIRIDE